ncbi:MAG: hypothetical protein FWG77_10850 [Treponema sp.]|nr:hypothetical protein [Treponema sp.]
MKIKMSPIRIVSVVGLCLLLVLVWGLVFFTVIWDGPIRRTEENFSRSLREYDQFNPERHILAGEDPREIMRRLNNLQRLVYSAEEQLSVIKRYRTLAGIDRSFISAYRDAAKSASEAFPYSAPIAAIAADALIFDDSPITPEIRTDLLNYSSIISQNQLGLLQLSMLILAGSLDDPAVAADLPSIVQILSMDFPLLPLNAQRELQTYNFLLRAYNSDTGGAMAALNNILTGNFDDRIARMGAEFFFDNGSYMRAAELFIHLGGERDLARAADAYVYAGEIQAARNIWLALGNYYNLASTAGSPEEELQWLERVFSQRVLSLRSGGGQGVEDRIGLYSIIRYTRLLDQERSIAILQEFEGTPLLDLEMLYRNMENWPPTRINSEIWMLINRHTDSEELYEWAAWYFDFQRQYQENILLLRNAQRLGMSGQWLNTHRGLALIREGRTAEGERFFLEGGGLWHHYANLGLMQEGRGNISAALEYYRLASAHVSHRQQQARLQLYISRCFNALGREAEGRRAIEQAYELDPDNIIIRREFTRL